MQLNTGETVLYSGRDDNRHMEGVAIMMSQEATKALIDRTAINERIIKAGFYSKYMKLTLVHVCAPTNDADEQTKEGFYEKLQEVAEQVQRNDMVIISEDINGKHVDGTT